MQTVTYYCHGIAREVHENCMKLQTSSESNPSDRDIALLRIKSTPKVSQIWQQHLDPIYIKHEKKPRDSSCDE